MSLDLSLEDLAEEDLTDRTPLLLDNLLGDLDEDLLCDINDLIFIDIILVHAHMAVCHAVALAILATGTVLLISIAARQTTLAADFRPRALLELVIIVTLLSFIIFVLLLIDGLLLHLLELLQILVVVVVV